MTQLKSSPQFLSDFKRITAQYPGLIAFVADIQSISSLEAVASDAENRKTKAENELKEVQDNLEKTKIEADKFNNRIEEDSNVKIQAANDEASKIVADAKTTAERIKFEAVANMDKAKQQADDVVKKAQDKASNIEKESLQATAELNELIKEIAERQEVLNQINAKLDELKSHLRV